MLENKACGFEVHEARLGAVILRTESCKKRLLDYVAGKISAIPELSEDILLFECDGFGKSIFFNGFTSTYSSNPM